MGESSKVFGVLKKFYVAKELEPTMRNRTCTWKHGSSSERSFEKESWRALPPLVSAGAMVAATHGDTTIMQNFA